MNESQKFLREAYQQVTEQSSYSCDVKLVNQNLFKEHHQLWYGKWFWSSHKRWAVLTVDYNWEEMIVEPITLGNPSEGDLTKSLGNIYFQKQFPTYQRYVKQGDMKAAQIELEAFLESPKAAKHVFDKLVIMGYPFIKDPQMVDFVFKEII